MEHRFVVWALSVLLLLLAGGCSADPELSMRPPCSVGYRPDPTGQRCILDTHDGGAASNDAAAVSSDRDSEAPRRDGSANDAALASHDSGDSSVDNTDSGYDAGPAPCSTDDECGPPSWARCSAEGECRPCRRVALEPVSLVPPGVSRLGAELDLGGYAIPGFGPALFVAGSYFDQGGVERPLHQFVTYGRQETGYQASEPGQFEPPLDVAVGGGARFINPRAMVVQRQNVFDNRLGYFATLNGADVLVLGQTHGATPIHVPHDGATVGPATFTGGHDPHEELVDEYDLNGPGRLVWFERDQAGSTSRLRSVTAFSEGSNPRSEEIATDELDALEGCAGDWVVAARGPQLWFWDADGASGIQAVSRNDGMGEPSWLVDGELEQNRYLLVYYDASNAIVRVHGYRCTALDRCQSDPQRSASLRVPNVENLRADELPGGGFILSWTSREMDGSIVYTWALDRDLQPARSGPERITRLNRVVHAFDIEAVEFGRSTESERRYFVMMAATLGTETEVDQMWHVGVQWRTDSCEL